MTPPKFTPTHAIIVRQVGQYYGHRATVYVADRQVHETRLVPFGFGSQAWRQAAEWAVERGYRVDGYEPEIRGCTDQVETITRVAMPGKIDVAGPALRIGGAVRS